MASAPDRLRADAPSLNELRLAHRAAAAHGLPDAAAAVTWSSGPELPSSLAAAIRNEWGIDIAVSSGGLRLADLPTMAAVIGQARAEQIVRALSHRTNLVLPGTRAIIAGDGVLAETLTRMLRRGGARVLRAASGPARVRAVLDGLEVVGDAPAGWPPVDTVLLTGEGHPALDPAAVTGVVLDASIDGTGVLPRDGEVARPFVTQMTERTWVVEPPPAVADPAEATALEWHIADVVVAASLLVAADTDAADARLAELVLA